MPQLTLDGVTDRARNLADRTTAQATRMMTGALTTRATRSASASGGLAAMRDRARGIATGAQVLRSAPASARLAWRAGKLVGRAQGARALAPHVVRGQWAGITGQMQARATRAQMRTIARWLPAALAGTRLVGQAWPVLMRRGQPARPADRSQLGKLAWRAGQMTGAMRGAAAGSKVVARGTSARAKAGAKADTKAARAATKAATTGKATGRGQWLLRRSTPQGTMQATGGRLRRGWRWMRLFALGLTVGATWAYLFAPRRGPAHKVLTENPVDVTQPA